MEAISRPSKVAFFGAVLLAAGNCIGAGMLALPVLTGLVGFGPTCLIYLISWAVMTYSAFLFLEVNLSLKGDVNLISMAKATLGKPGQIFAFIMYIFLFYSVSTAYLAGSGSIINDFLQSIFHTPFPRWTGIVLSLALFGPSIYFGTRVVAGLNSVLVFGIGISYFFLILLGSSLVNPSRLSLINLPYIWMGIPVIVTSFTFQNVIPSITQYLKRDLNLLKGVMWLGGLIPLVIYVLWQWFVLGVVPLEGPHSLRQMLTEGQPISHSLKYLLGSASVVSFSQLFAFCAIITSFLGVILSLFDFLADGFKIKKVGTGKIILCLMIFVPPLMCCLMYPKAFLSALNYAGSFGCVSLFILLPALMAFKSRYHLKDERPFQVKGGKPALAALVVIGLSVFLIQFLLTFGVLKTS